jgi:Mn-dependent DtxR family transcriptional regulator
VALSDLDRQALVAIQQYDGKPTIGQMAAMLEVGAGEAAQIVMDIEARGLVNRICAFEVSDLGKELLSG